MTELPSAPLALHLDSAALKSNWQWLARRSGDARCGAAIKANGYGLGAIEVMRHLKAAGCRDFFVATWREAAALMPHRGDASLSVLHGVRAEDMAFARGCPVRPVLNSVGQVARWKAAGGGPCDLMVDTGMSRLGLDPQDISADLLEGLEIETLLSHLACADEDHPLNAAQCALFHDVAARVPAKRLSLANSAGILLGPDYHFDLTRPGLALYGGVPRPEAAGHLAQVVRPRAQILQRRTVKSGAIVGYGATFRAPDQREVAVLNVGYADGYLRGFSSTGAALADGVRLPVLGRVSMDLLIVDVSQVPSLGEGDWVELDYDLTLAAAQSGLSQYELLTGLGARYERVWR
ncbi:putative alanine racemase [Sphingobium sp. SYK-6]|uniref:alanine racemase n=1 Tax=Sphingobium sp. (strain NBRC 103272 / SYK-6) TaxID=627192 RepID=UPI0002277505|nr:alanine racemase [Sphingobium sp. SYK-6]BAK67140.1 putative alanine racemase [Sphingobium sp. SYK-6]